MKNGQFWWERAIDAYFEGRWVVWVPLLFGAVYAVDLATPLRPSIGRTDELRTRALPDVWDIRCRSNEGLARRDRDGEVLYLYGDDSPCWRADGDAYVWVGPVPPGAHKY